jgi:hypothetical protein
VQIFVKIGPNIGKFFQPKAKFIRLEDETKQMRGKEGNKK